MLPRNWISVFACLISILICVTPSSAEPQVIEIDKAIGLFSAMEQQYEVLEWTIKSARWQLKNPRDTSSVVKKLYGDFWTGEVRFDPHARRYLTKEQGVRPWIKSEGASIDSMAINESRGFDGGAYRHFSQEGEGKTLEAAMRSPKSGQILSAESIDEEYINTHAGAMAFGFMPPYIFHYDLPPMAMSKLLPLRQKKGDTVVVTEDEKGVLRVTFEWTKSGEPAATMFSGSFDTNRGGTCVEWSVSGGDTLGTIWQRCEFDNIEVSQGLWAPREVRVVSPMEMPPYMDKLTLSDVRINPELSPDAFIVEFPTGTYVDDYIENRSYTVTGGAIDEQAAVKDFLTRHPFATAKTEGGWLRWLGLAALVICTAVSAFAWRRWRRSAAGIILFVSLGTTAQAQELSSEPQSSTAVSSPIDETADYVISHHPAERIRVAECGFTVTLFTLEYFGVSYELKHIKSALRQTDHGIRLSDISQLLQVYGLSCEARQNVDPASLERLVKQGYLAVFPVRLAKPMNHYLVGLLGQDGEPKAVDVLRSVTPLSNLVLDSHQTDHSGVVLMVRRGEPSGDRMAMNACLRATPANVDLGSFSLNSAERRAEFILENTSSHPIFVKSATASCGCTELDWRGGIIRVGEKQSVTVTARPMAWGTGKQRKEVTFKCLDESEIKLGITGEGQSSEQVHQLSVTPQRMRVEIGSGMISGTYLPVQKITVTGELKVLSQLKAETSSKWLKVEVVNTDDRRREVLSTVSVQDAVDALAEASELTGEIELSTNSDVSPIVIPVIVSISKFFEVSSRRLELEQGFSSEVVFQPLELEAKSISMGHVQSTPPGLTFDHQLTGNRLKLLVRADARTKAGLYVVRCQVYSDSSRLASTNLIVKVTPCGRTDDAKNP